MAANLFDQIDWGSTRIDATVGDWTRYVGDFDPGVIEWVTFTSPSPTLYGGDIELGAPRITGRRFSFWVNSVFDGTATSTTGAHWEEIEDLQALFNPGASGLVELKTQRKDAGNNTISRSIWVRCVSASPATVVRDAGSSGILMRPGRGQIRYKVDCYAPFPLWRDTTASTTACTTGATTCTATIGGPFPVGVKVTFDSVSGATSCALSNNQNAYVVTFTSPATTTVGDFYYTDPTTYSLTTATVNTSAMFVLSGATTNTITKTVTGTSAAITLTWRNHWATP